MDIRELCSFAKDSSSAANYETYLILNVLSIARRMLLSDAGGEVGMRFKKRARSLFNVLKKMDERLGERLTSGFWGLIYLAFSTVYAHTGKMVAQIDTIARRAPILASGAQPVSVLTKTTVITAKEQARALGAVSFVVNNERERVWLSFHMPRRLAATPTVTVNGHVVQGDLLTPTSLHPYYRNTVGGGENLVHFYYATYMLSTFSGGGGDNNNNSSAFTFTYRQAARSLGDLREFYATKVPRVQEDLPVIDDDVVVIVPYDSARVWICPYTQSEATMPVFSVNCSAPHVCDIVSLYQAAEEQACGVMKCAACRTTITEASIRRFI